jgi:hypothetical protein
MKLTEKTRIFVDLDDVLVDFYGHCATQLFGIGVARLKEIVKAHGQWSITSALGIEEQALWDKIKAYGPEFWVNIPELPWASEVMNFLYRKVGRQNVYILTSHGGVFPTDVTWGKMRWLEKNTLNLLPKNFIVTSEKHLFAKEGCILLDDKGENVSTFTIAGGTGLTFPSPGNNVFETHLHQYDDSGVEMIMAWVSSLLGEE